MFWRPLPSSTINSVKDINEANNGEKDVEEYGPSQTPPQPQVNVTFEKRTGNGFKDVAGMRELKSNLTRNFIDIMKNRELAEQFQIMPPNSTLLYSLPSVGKMFIVNKLAEESGLSYVLVNPRDLANIYLHGS